MLLGAGLTTLTPFQAHAAKYSDETRAEEIRKKGDPRIPGYQKTKPSWAFAITSSLRPLGEQNFLPLTAEESKKGTTLRGLSAQFEWQPKFVQAIGVLGIGVSAGAYRFFDLATTKPAVPTWPLYSVGGQIRYQLRVFREQPIVPMFGYSAEFNRVLLRSMQGNFLTHGWVAGAGLLLNIFEPSAAANFYARSGISRSYLVAELRNMTSNDPVLSFSGRSLFFGLRMEF